MVPARRARRRRLAAVCTAALLSALSAGAAWAAPGDPDNTFDTDGKLTLPSPSSDEAFDVAVQPDGKIVVVGDTTSNGDAMVWRLNPNGSPDTSFNPMGLTPGQIAVDHMGNEIAFAVDLAPDGKIVAAGVTSNGGDGFIFRLNTDGSLDTASLLGTDFSDDGKATTSFGADFEQLNDVVVQPDGKVVAVGQSESSTDALVYRFDAVGEPDASFDTNGRQEINTGGNEVGNAVALDPSGNILVAGTTTYLSGGGFVSRLLGSNGALDGGFGVGGSSLFGTAGTDEVLGLASQPDAKPIIAGSTSTNGDGVIWRRTSNGLNDSGFDGDSQMIIDSAGTETLNDVKVQPDGKLVVGGRTTATNDSAVYRINPNGGFDPTFAGDGAMGIDNGTPGDMVEGLDLQPDGKIVAAGTAEGPTGFVFRLEGDPAAPLAPATLPGAAQQAATPRCPKGKKLKTIRTKKGKKKKCAKKRKKGKK